MSSLTNLTSLNLSFNQIGDEGARALSLLTNLTSLDLQYNQIGDEGARALSSLTNLTLLDLSGCSLTMFPRDLLHLPILSKLDLRGNMIVDLASELWSEQSNCLPIVRAHFADLEQGAEADRELKLMLLGNGRVGKTSIVRFLMNEPFNENENSTHAIQLRARNEAIAGDDVRVNIWDFGGQDIYFNTHSLFLKSRAVFLIVWDTTTEAKPHYQDANGLQFDNRPLQFWIDYVKSVSPNSPLIVVQNKCDDGIGSEPPANLEGAERMTFSATHPDLNGEALIALIRGKIRGVLRHPDALAIGKGRWRVKQKIRKMQDDDEARSNEQRRNRLMTYERFVELCEEQPGTISSPELLLQFLHDTGVVYYRPDLFANQIILDQRWAIEAVYTIFHREKCYRQLKQRDGRFTLQDLADLAWDDQNFSAAEQRLFLSFMESCSICFPVGEEDGESVYIAPQLLPEREAVRSQLRELLAERLLAVNESGSFYYRYRHRFLHEGIMQRFMARIGSEFGDRAIYWRDGVQFSWQDRGSSTLSPIRALAEVVCHRHLDNNPARGEIVLTSWGDGREQVITRLRTMFQELHRSETGIEESASIDGKTWVSPDELPHFAKVQELLSQPDDDPEHRGLRHLF